MHYRMQSSQHEVVILLVIISILYMRKLTLKEARDLAKFAHLRWQSQELNPGLTLTPKS